MRSTPWPSTPTGVPRGLLLLLAFSAGLALLGLTAGCNRPSGASPDQAAQAPAAETPEVKVVKPERKDVRRLIERPGFNIEAYERTPLYAKIPGYVQRWHVDIGDRVKKDQVLAELYVPEMVDDLKEKRAAVELAAAQIKQAEAARLTAEAQVARTK